MLPRRQNALVGFDMIAKPRTSTGSGNTLQHFTVAEDDELRTEMQDGSSFPTMRYSTAIGRSRTRIGKH